ncbi:hypothetical protein [Luteolibacter marinus]|uniref:hypothetical protein n=1 Tax=Luteolibacter marinus TaxID=2776705 RepID=UPI0018671592|nr:hypothetical protein [Luteolibacter marinus]
MKAFLAILLAAATAASAFDEEALGASLNGWTRDGSAHYSLGGVTYRTTRPVETAQADGSTMVAVTVMHRANSWAWVPFELEVTFAPDGSALAFRIHGMPRGHEVDTGAITRPERPSVAEGEAAPPFHPLAEMKKQLFDAFVSQVTEVADAKDLRKRDLLARINGPEPIDPAAITTGLRYNLDRILGLRPQVPSK